MGKLLLWILIFFLCFSVTRQKKGIERVKRQRKDGFDVLNIRAFRGHPPPEASAFPFPEATEALVSSDFPPALFSLSNTSAEFLGGSLSTRVIPVVYLLVIIVGIPTNVAILIGLFTKITDVPSAILYCSLAMSDLLLLLSLCFKAHYRLNGNHWPFGETTCRLVTACFYGNLYCSATTLACISINRYLAVTYPFWYKNLPKIRYSTYVVVVVWAMFGAAIIPEFLVQQSYRLPEVDRLTCHDVLPLDYDSHHFLLYYNLFLTIFGLLVPLVITVVCFSKTVRKFQHLPGDWVMYIRAYSLIFGIFLVCFTPAGLLRFMHYVQLFADGTETLYVYFKAAVCLCCVHACLDPFLCQLMAKVSGSELYFRPSLKCQKLNILI